jgi:hypothetical protein
MAAWRSRLFAMPLWSGLPPPGPDDCEPLCPAGQVCVNRQCVACGGASQVCCADDVCGAGQVCGPGTGGGACAARAAAWPSPAAWATAPARRRSGSIDGEDLNDVCGVCGAPGQTCCAGGDEACVAEHRCLSPARGEPETCRPCGGMDQPCCGGAMPCMGALKCLSAPDGDSEVCMP